MRPDQRAAYEALHAAVEAVARLPDDSEVDDTVTVTDPPEQRMVVEYVVMAAVRSPGMVEDNLTQYQFVSRDDKGRPLLHHHAEGLAQRLLWWLGR